MYTTGMFEGSQEIIVVAAADAVDGPGVQTSGVVNGDGKVRRPATKIPPDRRSIRATKMQIKVTW